MLRKTLKKNIRIKKSIKKSDYPNSIEILVPYSTTGPPPIKGFSQGTKGKKVKIEKTTLIKFKKMIKDIVKRQADVDHQKLEDEIISALNIKYTDLNNKSILYFGLISNSSCCDAWKEIFVAKPNEDLESILFKLDKNFLDGKIDKNSYKVELNKLPISYRLLNHQFDVVDIS